MRRGQQITNYGPGSTGSFLGCKADCLYAKLVSRLLAFNRYAELLLSFVRLHY